MWPQVANAELRLGPQLLCKEADTHGRTIGDESGYLLLGIAELVQVRDVLEETLATRALGDAYLWPAGEHAEQESADHGACGVDHAAYHHDFDHPHLN
jgi:hypothetical protein